MRLKNCWARSCGRISGDWTARRHAGEPSCLFRSRPSKIYCCQCWLWIMPIDAREYVVVPAAPQPDPVVYKQDWRLVAVILGLALLVVLFAVM